MTEADFQEMSKQTESQTEKFAEKMKKFDEKVEKETEEAKDEAKRWKILENPLVYDGSHCMCGAPFSAWDSDDEGEMSLGEEVTQG